MKYSTYGTAATLMVVLWGGVVEAGVRVAVSPFLDRSGRSESTSTTVGNTTTGTAAASSVSASKGDLGGQVADAIITELVKLGRYDVVERIQLEKVIAEQKLNLADLSDTTKASDAARILGASVIITGSITEAASSATGSGFLVVKKKQLLGRVVLDARLVDIRTTRAIWGTTTEGVEEIRSRDVLSVGGSKIAGVDLLLGKAARKAANKLVEELVPVLDQFGGGSGTAAELQTVASVRGDRLYLAMGAKQGVVAGDRFELVGLGSAFKVGDKTIQEEVVLQTITVDLVQAEYSSAPAPAVVVGQKLDGVKARRVASAAPAAAPPRAIASPAAAAPPSADASARSSTVYVTVAAKLRSAPNTTSAIVATIDRGTALQVRSIEGSWLQVRTGRGDEGWVLGSLTSSTKP